MAATDSSTLSNQYQKYFSKKLLMHAIQALALVEFAMKADLPKRAGAKVVSFFRKAAADASQVQTLAEGTVPTERRNVTLTKIDCTLVQIGEIAELTDIVGMTALFDALQQHIDTMGEDAALDADDTVRDILVAGITTAGQRRYSQGLADFSALNSASVANSKFVRSDGLVAATQLAVNRAPKINGYYPGVVCPQVAKDLKEDSDWINASLYSGVRQLFKGEIGELDGVRYVEATNPFIEDTTGSQGTYAADGNAFRSFFFGKDAYGVPKLSGDTPWSPKVMISDQPDKSDPLNQKLMAGWKAFYCAKLLNESFIVSMSSKSTFS